MTNSVLAASLLDSVNAGRAGRAEHGYSVAQSALAQDALTELRTDLSRTRWQELEPVVGQVTQTASEYVAGPTSWLAVLTRDLAVAGYIPTDASPELTFMRYPALAGHVSAHKDRRAYVGLVIVVSVEGTADFRIHRTRATDDVIARWTARPGDVVVMSGAPWTARNGVDSRPLHSVWAHNQERFSATVRYRRPAREPHGRAARLP